MSKQFDGRVAFVTGAAVGIGAATARAFAGGGASVGLADVSPEGEKVAAGIRESGARAVFVRCDVSKEIEVAAATQRAVDEFGALHFAFNCAGIEGPVNTAANYKLD